MIRDADGIGMDAKLSRIVTQEAHGRFAVLNGGGKLGFTTEPVADGGGDKAFGSQSLR